jgi:hypothetical protein
MTTLVNGKIPANTVCPYRARCPFAEKGTCHHKGVDHNCAFSCGAARAYAIIDRSPVCN